jgi:hypothetical protein
MMLEENAQTVEEAAARRAKRESVGWILDNCVRRKRDYYRFCQLSSVPISPSGNSGGIA